MTTPITDTTPATSFFPYGRQPVAVFADQAPNDPTDNFYSIVTAAAHGYDASNNNDELVWIATARAASGLSGQQIRQYRNGVDDNATLNLPYSTGAIQAMVAVPEHANDAMYFVQGGDLTMLDRATPTSLSVWPYTTNVLNTVNSGWTLGLDPAASTGTFRQITRSDTYVYFARQNNSILRLNIATKVITLAVPATRFGSGPDFNITAMTFDPHMGRLLLTLRNDPGTIYALPEAQLTDPKFQTTLSYVLDSDLSPPVAVGLVPERQHPRFTVLLENTDLTRLVVYDASVSPPTTIVQTFATLPDASAQPGTVVVRDDGAFLYSTGGSKEVFINAPNPTTVSLTWAAITDTVTPTNFQPVAAYLQRDDASGRFLGVLDPSEVHVWSSPTTYVSALEDWDLNIPTGLQAPLTLTWSMILSPHTPGTASGAGNSLHATNDMQLTVTLDLTIHDTSGSGIVLDSTLAIEVTAVAGFQAFQTTDYAPQCQARLRWPGPIVQFMLTAGHAAQWGTYSTREPWRGLPPPLRFLLTRNNSLSQTITLAGMPTSLASLISNAHLVTRAGDFDIALAGIAAHGAYPAAFMTSRSLAQAYYNGAPECVASSLIFRLPQTTGGAPAVTPAWFALDYVVLGSVSGYTPATYQDIALLGARLSPCLNGLLATPTTSSVLTSALNIGAGAFFSLTSLDATSLVLTWSASTAVTDAITAYLSDLLRLRDFVHPDVAGLVACGDAAGTCDVTFPNLVPDAGICSAVPANLGAVSADLTGLAVIPFRGLGESSLSNGWVTQLQLDDRSHGGTLQAKVLSTSTGETQRAILPVYADSTAVSALPTNHRLRTGLLPPNMISSHNDYAAVPWAFLADGALALQAPGSGGATSLQTSFRPTTDPAVLHYTVDFLTQCPVFDDFQPRTTIVSSSPVETTATLPGSAVPVYALDTDHAGNMLHELTFPNFDQAHFVAPRDTTSATASYSSHAPEFCRARRAGAYLTRGLDPDTHACDHVLYSADGTLDVLAEWSRAVCSPWTLSSGLPVWTLRIDTAGAAAGLQPFIALNAYLDDEPAARATDADGAEAFGRPWPLTTPADNWNVVLEFDATATAWPPGTTKTLRLLASPSLDVPAAAELAWTLRRTTAGNRIVLVDGAPATPQFTTSFAQCAERDADITMDNTTMSLASSAATDADPLNAPTPEWNFDVDGNLHLNTSLASAAFQAKWTSLASRQFSSMCDAAFPDGGPVAGQSFGVAAGTEPCFGPWLTAECPFAIADDVVTVGLTFAAEDIPVAASSRQPSLVPLFGAAGGLTTAATSPPRLVTSPAFRQVVELPVTNWSLLPQAHDAFGGMYVGTTDVAFCPWKTPFVPVLHARLQLIAAVETRWPQGQYGPRQLEFHIQEAAVTDITVKACLSSYNLTAADVTVTWDAASQQLQCRLSTAAAAAMEALAGCFSDLCDVCGTEVGALCTAFDAAVVAGEAAEAAAEESNGEPQPILTADKTRNDTRLTRGIILTTTGSSLLVGLLVLSMLYFRHT